VLYLNEHSASIAPVGDPVPVDLPNCQIINCQPVEEGYILTAYSINKQASCPLCRHVLSRSNGFYYRKSTDLPSEIVGKRFKMTIIAPDSQKAKDIEITASFNLDTTGQFLLVRGTKLIVKPLIWRFVAVIP
jgi:hypothetical protein